jgi:fructokinase
VRIVSIGEVLWDVIGGEEHFGGAPMNFAAHIRRLGHEVRFISGIGDDERGSRVLARMNELHVDSRYVRRTRKFATGLVTVEFNDGQPQFTIHRPAAYDDPHLENSMLAEVAAWNPHWVYFGTLAQTGAQMRETLNTLLAGLPKANRFYDVNLRIESYSLPLLNELLEFADVVKLNDMEAGEIAAVAGFEYEGLKDFCRKLSERYSLDAVCVTRGGTGCSLLVGNHYVEHPAYAVRVADTVGAGDAFAAALVHGLGERWEPMRIAEFCNRVGALVASRPGAIPSWRMEELEQL